jgi:hypothetical protein
MAIFDAEQEKMIQIKINLKNVPFKKFNSTSKYLIQDLKQHNKITRVEHNIVPTSRLPSLLGL